MKIVKNAVKVDFCDLMVGDCFACEDRYYMKTSQIETNRVVINAVNLLNGDYVYFSDCDTVDQVEATLTIN